MTIYKFGAARSDKPLSPRPLDGDYAEGSEPSLAEILADPILHAVMNRDGVTMDELNNHIGQAQDNLASQKADPALEQTAA